MLTETFSTGYATLFQVQILHRYFLNVGRVAFDAAAPPAAVRPALAAARRTYDVSQFWRLAPDADTRETLRNNRLLFKPLPDGFRVGMPVNGSVPAVLLPEELTLTFLVYPVDGLFALYTDVDRAVLDALARPAPPVPPATAPQPRVFGWANKAGSHALNGNETIRTVDLRPRPPGSETAPPLGLIEIRHRAVGGPSLLTGAGHLASPVFTALLRNRTTHWEYQHTDLGTFPLVQAGRVSLSGGSPPQPLPNPTPATTTDRGSAFVSVIY